MSHPPTVERSPAPASLAAPSRATWIGQLVVGPVRIPVRGFTAIRSLHSPLHGIHVGCGERLKQPRICPHHGIVAENEAGKAFELAPGELVPLDAAELERLDVEDDKTLPIERFFPRERLDLHLLGGRSLHLLPAHALAAPAYALLLDELAERGLCGLGRLVSGGRRPFAVLRPDAGRGVVHVLHWPHLASAIGAAPSPETAPTREETTRLRQFIESQTGDVDWTSLSDDWDDRLAELVRKTLATRSAKSPRRRRSETPRRSKAA